MTIRRSTGDQAVKQQVRQQERREVVERERVLQPVGGDVAVRPKPADVVDEDIQPWIRGQHVVGQAMDLGLR